MKSKVSNRTFDTEKPPRLTAKERREIDSLKKTGGQNVDVTDLPELDDEFWKRAVRNPLYTPVKRQLTVRLDADVLAWLRARGPGYQTKMNAILREAMLEDLEKEA